MQINVEKGRLTNNFILISAYEKKVDILLIQELQIGADLEKKLSKRYKSYQAYILREE